jgi:ariadne-1
MEEEAEGWDEEGWDEEPPLVEKISERSLIKTKDYVCHSSDEIEERQKKIIEEAIELLGLSEDDAISCLKHYTWNPEKLQEQWFDNEAKAREQCGLTEKKFLVSRDMDKQDLCYICYSKLDIETSDALKCGHYFCSGCWNDYFKNKLTDGYHCVFATCPYFKCPLAVTHATWLRHLDGADKQKYINFHCKSYTDDTKSIKWCPSPGCKYCIENISFASAEIE